MPNPGSLSSSSSFLSDRSGVGNCMYTSGRDQETKNESPPLSFTVARSAEDAGDQRPQPTFVIGVQQSRVNHIIISIILN